MPRLCTAEPLATSEDLHGVGRATRDVEGEGLPPGGPEPSGLREATPLITGDQQHVVVVAASGGGEACLAAGAGPPILLHAPFREAPSTPWEHATSAQRAAAADAPPDLAEAARVGQEEPACGVAIPTLPQAERVPPSGDLPPAAPTSPAQGAQQPREATLPPPGTDQPTVGEPAAHDSAPAKPASEQGGNPPCAAQPGLPRAELPHGKAASPPPPQATNQPAAPHLEPDPPRSPSVQLGAASPDTKSLLEELESPIAASAITRAAPSHPTLRHPPSTSRPPLAPENRGGRPRASEASRSRGDETPSTASAKPARPDRPELTCWREGMGWAVGIEVPDEDAEQQWRPVSDAAVTQEEPVRWRLESPLGAVEMIEERSGERLTCPAERYRIFRLSPPDYERGRYVRRLSRAEGRYLIVTPADWVCNETCKCWLAEDSVAIGAGDLRAHRVDACQALPPQLSFDTPDGPVYVPTTASLFKLTGEHVKVDRHPRAGPLFCNEPPQLQLLGDARVAKVVVGMEGAAGGLRRPRHVAPTYEELRKWIGDQGVGWFYVRLYDDHDELIDSLDFRFVQTLQDVREDRVDVLPGEDGHGTVTFTLVHAKGLVVKRKKASGQDRVQVQETGQGTLLEIPPSVACDDTTWLLTDPATNRSTELYLQVDRLWWCAVEEGSSPHEASWQDRPLRLTSDDFRATSKRVLRFRLPAGWDAGNLHVGLSPNRRLPCRRVPGQARQAQLACRELERYEELTSPDTYAEIILWTTDRNGTKMSDGQVVLATKGWRAEEILCEQSIRGRSVVLNVRWKERGETKHKYVRLWRMGNPWSLVYQRNVAVAKMEVSLSPEQLEPGEYLIELVPGQAVRKDSARPPRPGQPSTCHVVVEPLESLLVNHTFVIEHVLLPQSRSEHLLLSLKYHITIKGRIINRVLNGCANTSGVWLKKINEGWYCGELRIIANDGAPQYVQMLDRINPVKLDLDSEAWLVRTIEDRNGDGPLYCRDCRQLFWPALEEDCKRRRHSLHGPCGLQFRVSGCST